MAKKKNGRPSKYEKINQKRFQALYLAGFDDKQTADFFDITEMTLTRWKQKHEKFCLSLKDWKKEADVKVEKSLYQRALGYNYDEVVYEKSKIGGLGLKLKDEEIEAIKHVETNKVKVTTKHVLPDVTAQIFWLKNRQPQDWRDKTEIDHTIKEYLNEDYKDKTVEELEKMADELRTKRIEGSRHRKRTGLHKED